MNHLMIDLETMGNKPTAPIVTIGAIFFDPQTGSLGAEFYMAVNLASAMEQGATPDGDTILWWLKQSAEARADQTCPWQFWNDSDVRTMVLLGKELGFDPKRNMPFDGVAHNALADARHQAKYVSAIWQKLLPSSYE